MSFEKFKQLTQERNNTLPSNLQYGDRYIFHSADDHRFSFWLQPSLEKYQARIKRLDEVNPVVDLTSLPLVDGPYLKTPGGHDGFTEIRHPGSERTPLVLDYRVADRPVRNDNKASHPGPWIDRILALFDLALQLAPLARPKDMHTALADAAELYDEMLKLNTDANGPLLAPGLITGLATMNVDFSVPEVELREWLANPVFTPYPATSLALLLLKRKLKAPVFLDVISFNYDKRATSPRTVADVQPDVLKAAILEGWNVRYGKQVTDFEQILVP